MTLSSSLPRTDAATGADTWFDWLVGRRHGEDPEYAAALALPLADMRDRLLDQADIRPGQVVADVGRGYGFAGFGAFEREPNIETIFIDVSPKLLDRARAFAAQRGLDSRCRFVISRAEQLDGIADASVDVVLVRAVLAYVDDRDAALNEFRRILRPGGRLSIVDPIFADQAYFVTALGGLARDGGTGDGTRYAKLMYRLLQAYFPDSPEAIAASRLTNYNERTLLHFVERVGFVNVHLRLHIDVIPAPAIRWPAFLASAPRAGVPTVGEVIATCFTADERREFERLVRPSIEAGTLTERNVNAYIFADNGA